MAFIRVEGVPIVAFDLVGDAQTVNISASSGATGSPLKGGTVYRFWANIDCFITFGALSVTASTTSTPMTAKIPEYFTVTEGAQYCAVVSSGASGVLYISELH